MTSRLQIWFLLLGTWVFLYSWFCTQTASNAFTDVKDDRHDGFDGRRNIPTNIQTASLTRQSGLMSSNTPNGHLRSPRNLFDCSPEVQDPLCVFFDPSIYFHPTKSPLPRDTLQSLKHYWNNKFKNTTKANAASDLFWFSIQQDVGVYNLLEWNGVKSGISVSSPPKGWPRTIVGLHIHKCGGSSVGRTFLKIARSGGHSYNVTLFYKNDLRAKFRDNVESQSIELHHRILQQIYDNQQQTMLKTASSSSLDHVAFTFVREPVGRFLSSVREFLVSRNKRRRLCLEAPSSKDLLKCILSKLQEENGLQLDQHFAPATVSLHMFSLLEPRVKISVMPLTVDTMTTFQTTFLGPQPKTIKLKSSKPRKYNITLDELDDQMIEDICKIYAMDVLLLRHFGLPVPLCEGIV
ncbi:sulfotransferase family protein [Nitzschia inconspicua]|uniref:Sulfotransferase family protein n=1 Tax=Nitzschia inconspicua TaxID=303405 RepID=A0A9K3PL20_9STRA|nr:sulfotransferase family protein [Nitzschia inconspicua]